MIGLRPILRTDPRDRGSLVLAVSGSFLVILALILRLRLTSSINPDYTQFLSPWYDHLKTNGLHGFKVRFSDYNFPYLFLLYLSTFLPVTKIVAFKLIAISFDFVMAFAINLIVRKITGDKTRAIFVAIVSLFLPTVFINSSMWGQSDVLYTTFTLFSLYFVLNNRIGLSWSMFGVALAFKLQAIFFLPVLAYVWMHKKGRWYSPLLAIPVFLLLSIPPVLVGRPLGDTLGVYLHQYGAYPLLSISAPNLYFGMPASVFYLWNGPAILLSVGTVAILLTFCILRVAFTPGNLVVISALFLLIAPFLLPQMHERYFYGFEMLCLIMASMDHRKIWLVVASQFVAFFSYSSFLFGTSIIPWPYLTMLMCGLVAYFSYLIVHLSAGPATRPDSPLEHDSA